MSPKSHKRGDGRQTSRKRDGSQRSNSDRGRKGDDRRSMTSVSAGELPRWVRDEITRTAPKARREPAIAHLSKAVSEFADERYGAAFQQLKSAKDLAPQAATVRELLGLSAYHLERWQEALKEMRTFRRLTGETTQMPVELDSLRALGRPEDVEKTWKLLQTLDHSPATDDEARVVYASALLDRGLVADAWKVIKPGRLVANPKPSSLRRWYVAARVAAAAGESDAARTIANAVAEADAEFPGLTELLEEIE